METYTTTSDGFRTQWGQIIERAIAGVQIIVERYGRPVIVVMSYKEHQKREERLRELEQQERNRIGDEIFANWENTDYVTVRTREDLEAILNAPGD